MSAETEWTRTTDGTEYRVMTTEILPGIYQITSDLLEQLLTETGWTKVPQ